MKKPEIKVSLGCGMRCPKGFIGIDIRKYRDVKYVMNIGREKLPFKDNSVDYIESIHLYEHFYAEELFFSIEECFRVLKPTGILRIEVPLFCDDDGRITKAYVVHPDHKQHFARDTFGFWQVPADVDRNGYNKGFFHLEFVPNGNPEAISVNFYPNKIGIEKYPYKEVIKMPEYES